VVSANAAGSLSEVVRRCAVVAATPLPQGVSVRIEGQFQAQEDAQARIAGLAACRWRWSSWCSTGATARCAWWAW
jgi:hypothetical protein